MKRRLLEVLAAIVFLGLVGSVSNCALAPNSQARPTSVPWVRPTPRPWTPPPATVVTQAATPTPIPTATAVPLCEREAEQEYLKLLGYSMGAIDLARQELGALFVEAGHDQYLLLDDEWKEEVLVLLGAIEISSGLIQLADAPSSLLMVSTPAGRYSREWHKSAQALREAVEELEPDKIDVGMSHMERATEYLVDTANAMKRICGL